MNAVIIKSNPSKNGTFYSYLEASVRLKELISVRVINVNHLHRLMEKFKKLINYKVGEEFKYIRQASSAVLKAFGELTLTGRHAVQLASAIITVNNPILNSLLVNELQPITKHIPLQPARTVLNITDHNFNEAISHYSVLSEMYGRDSVVFCNNLKSKPLVNKFNSIVNP